MKKAFKFTGEYIILAENKKFAEKKICNILKKLDYNLILEYQGKVNLPLPLEEKKWLNFTQV